MKAEACYSARIISSLIFQMGHNINRMTVHPLQARSFRSVLCLSMSTYCRPQVSDIYCVGLSKSSQSTPHAIRQEFHNQTVEKVLIGYLAQIDYMKCIILEIKMKIHVKSTLNRRTRTNKLILTQFPTDIETVGSFV